MDYVQACEVGREAVNSVTASVLANVLRDLVARYQQSRRAKLHLCDVQIRCADRFEIRRIKPRKFGEDEGFESDEDARSTTSSCCMVEDHVFKGIKTTDAIDRASPSANSISLSTDSANSSGSSDTDDVESPSPLGRPSFESYPIADVIFCHTEPCHPHTIAWVIKRSTSYFDTTSRLGKSGVENIHSNENCLDVVVVKCKSAEDFKKLCDSYRELSRRFKLDQYKSIHRKKPIVLSTLTDTKDVRVSLSDIKAAPSSLLKASEMSILSPKILSSFKTDLKDAVSLRELLKPQETPSPISVTDETREKSRFNLLHRTDLDGMTHIEVSKSQNKSKIQKEIEGVILTDVESSSRRDLAVVRQRQNPSVSSEPKLWRPEDSVGISGISSLTPPQRPERKKLHRRKAKAPRPPPFQNTYRALPSVAEKTQTYSSTPSIPGHSPAVSEPKCKSKFYLPIQDEDPANHNRYILLCNWKGKENSLGSWNTAVSPSERPSRKFTDETAPDRRRARSVGRTVRKAPMAHRYVDTMEPPTKPHKSDELPDMLRRRRNSLDDLIHLKSSLKSVIKTNKKIQNKYSEPKKVTFSAFATVQVVD